MTLQSEHDSAIEALHRARAAKAKIDPLDHLRMREAEEQIRRAEVVVQRTTQALERKSAGQS
jgi:hypothetical protein